MNSENTISVEEISIKDRLSNIDLFNQLEEKDLEKLVSGSVVRQFQPGAVVCQEGEYGETFFAILVGTVEVSINTEGYKNLTLALLGEGKIFGEMAALTGYPRSATVTAKEELQLVEIPSGVLKELMKSSPAFKEAIEDIYRERAIKTYLRKVPFFSKLNEPMLEKLEESVNLKRYNQGDVVFNEGDTGDSLYIIRTGFVKVTKKQLQKEQIIAYLSHGNYFGEMALLENEKRTATVSAFTNVELIQLLQEDFKMLIDADPAFGDEIRDLVTDRKLKTLEVQRDPKKAERLEALVEKGIIQSENLLVIDLKTCIHCDNCVEACEDRHGYPRLDRRGTRIADLSVPVACRLCQDPVCLICNFDAIKRAPTGEIHVINDKCVGCAGCAIRCPYNVIQMVSAKSEHQFKIFDLLGSFFSRDEGNKDVEVDSKAPKVKPKRLAIKCDNCMGYPDTACTNNCPTHAIRWINPVKYFDDYERDIVLKRKDFEQ